MSDEAQSSSWWQAADGRWYPLPPGLSDTEFSRPPTAPPDHQPRPFVPSGPTPTPFASSAEPSGRSWWKPTLLGALAVLVVIALIVGVTVAVADRSSTTASAKDPDYQLVMDQLIDSEITNLIFIETFWETYSLFSQDYDSADEADRPAIAQQWLDDIDAQVTQFQDDLDEILDTYAAQPYRNGSISDTIRDQAIDHYRTWASWASEILAIAREWLVVETSPLSLYGYVTEVAPSLDERIETTFTQLCATLEETQPKDGSYSQAIIDMCTTS